MSVLNVRNRATESRMPVGLSAMPLDQMSEEVLTAKTGGVVGLALGGLEKEEWFMDQAVQKMIKFQRC